MDNKSLLQKNYDKYEGLYSKTDNYLRYPADWIVRFHNMYLKHELPHNAQVLDYGCGSGNNSIFFLEKGYRVSGVDVVPSFKRLLLKNLEAHDFDKSYGEGFYVIAPDTTSLAFDNNMFDFIFANQVLYYLPSVEHLKNVCLELKRILKPGGIVFFTMMGLKNYYMTHHLKQIHNGRIYEMKIDDVNHRLCGFHEMILAVRDEEDLCQLFDMFTVVTTGYFDQSMFDMRSNFHYIFVGKKE